MRRSRPISFILAGAVLALCSPAAQAASAPSPAAMTLVVGRAIGSEAITVAGSAAPMQTLETALYAKYSRDLPTVLLSRGSVSTDAGGRYSTTLPTAPAFFRGAIVTVVITSPAGTRVSRTISVDAPNTSAPPDDLPSSLR